MGNRILHQTIETNKTPEEVRQAAVAMHRFLGGSFQMTSDGFTIMQGINGISQGAFVNLSAHVIIRRVKENTYEMDTFLNWNASSQTIVFIFLFWPVACLFFLFDPTQYYQYALNQIQNALEPNVQTQLFSK
jgi:hypothetical protein